MRLIQLSDCHLFSDKTYTGYASVKPYYALEQVMSLAASLQPDFIIFTGDISGDDSEQSYQHFLALLQTELPGVDYAVLPGNHDSNAFYETYLSKHSLFTESPLNMGRWQVHGLDTRYQGTLGRVDSTQLEQVKNAVTKHSEMYHLIALHHHPVDANSWMDKHALVNSHALISFVSETEQVKLIIHGHLHFPLARQIRNIPVLGVPSTCWQWQMTPEFAFSTDQPGLRIIDLHDNGSWSTQIRRV